MTINCLNTTKKLGVVASPQPQKGAKKVVCLDHIGEEPQYAEASTIIYAPLLYALVSRRLKLGGESLKRGEAKGHRRKKTAMVRGAMGEGGRVEKKQKGGEGARNWLQRATFGLARGRRRSETTEEVTV